MNQLYWLKVLIKVIAMQITRSLVLALVFVSLPVTAQVYRCEKDGQTVFSDSPCGDNAENLGDVTAPKPGGDFGSGLSENERNLRKAEGSLESINRKIDRAKDKRSDLRSEMDAKLDAVEARQRRANNNLAGATLEQSLAQEKRNIQDRYRSRIEEVNNTLERLQERRSEKRKKIEAMSN